MINPEKWIGYLEHQSRQDLNHFTANVGKGGCTIFASHLWAMQRRWLFGLPWCATFVHAVINRPDLLGKAHAGCRVLERRMRRKGLWRGKDYLPHRGDIILLSNSATDYIDHCGVVVDYKDGIVKSVEGNGKDTTGHFSPNQGGAVALMERKITNSKIVGYAEIWDLL